tara:strand:- start:1222 stop:1584 length:363 start_codon:yes stop_codon:yes gene_type:complete
MFDTLFNDINQNKYFIGFIMIILTIGGRFIIGELSPKQKKLIDNKILRRLFIFCAFFMATRDILKAIILTIIFIIVISEVLNDDDDDDEDGDKIDNNEKLNEAINILNDVRANQDIINLM